MAVDLPPPFQHGLDFTIAGLEARSTLVGLLFFGSAARGEPQAGSDLDLYAVMARDSDRHLGRVVGDVPVEISFGSLAQMAAQVRCERPTSVHAFATGDLLDRSDGAHGQ